jgi:hypothetical protein
MPVVCEFISVIIRRDSIDKYFQGGWCQFIIDDKGGPMCCDGELVSVGFMNSEATHLFLDYLKNKGLQYDQSLNNASTLREIDDIVILDRFMGHNESANWIDFGDRKFNDEKHFCCWLKGSSLETLNFSNGFGKGNEARIATIHTTPNEFNDNHYFSRTENDLDIYCDFEKKYEVYLPKNISIEVYYALSKNKRNLSKIRMLALQAEKKDKDNEMSNDINTNENWLLVQKNKEEKIYAEVLKTLNRKTIDKNKLGEVMEALMVNALNSEEGNDSGLVYRFWQLNCELGHFDELDNGDYWNIVVDPTKVLKLMKFEWEDYWEVDPSLVSDEEKFNIFKDKIEDEIENEVTDGYLYITKQFGEFTLRATKATPFEGLGDFDFFLTTTENNPGLKDSGYIESYDMGERNFTEQELRDYFNKNYYKSNVIDNLVKTLLDKEGVDAATKEFNENIRELIVDNKKQMMYSIPIDQVINNFKNSLIEQPAIKEFEYHKVVLEMNISDFQDGYVFIRHYDYFLTADWNLWEECSSFNLFNYESRIYDYYKEKELVLFSLDKQYPPLNYTDEEIRALFDSCAKKLL